MERVKQGFAARAGAAALCGLLALAPSRAADLPDGAWTVHGRGVLGTGCGDWSVRLSSAQGMLSGTVGLYAGTVAIQNLTLRPDGTFSGNTEAGWIGRHHVRSFQVSGRFVGDTVRLSLENRYCHSRSGSAVRR